MPVLSPIPPHGNFTVPPRSSTRTSRPVYGFPSRDHAVLGWAFSGASHVAVQPSEQDECLNGTSPTPHGVPRNSTGHRLQIPLALCCAHISFLFSCQIIPRSPFSGTTVSSHHHSIPAAHQLTLENCNPPSSSCGLGYDIVNNIGRIARIFGSATTFRAYLDISQSSKSAVTLRSELQSSGVSIIDCPHNGKKDVVDKMILGVYTTCYSFPRC